MNPNAGHLRLLLVAAQSETVQGLARDLFLLDEHLESAIRHNAAEALDLLEKEPFDAVTVDLRLPDNGAAVLLTALQLNFPRLLRQVIATDPADPVFANAAHLAHALLPRPCDRGTLYSTLIETAAVGHGTHDPSLLEAVTAIHSLPDAPSLRRELLGLLADDDLDLEKMEEAITGNPAMAGKILQVANSAYFGARGSVTSLGEAVSLIGLDTVRALVSSARFFDLAPGSGAGALPLEEIWQHCVRTALTVRRVAWHVRAGAGVSRAAFTAALLHDAGKIVMHRAHGEAYAALLRQPAAGARTLWLEEERLFAHHHGTAGAMLLELWGLPPSVVEAVALHHTPHRTRENTPTPLTLVHIANALVHQDGARAGSEARLDFNYLQRLLLPGKLDAWQTAISAG